MNLKITRDMLVKDYKEDTTVIELLNDDKQYAQSTKWVLVKTVYDYNNYHSYDTMIEHYDIILGVYSDFDKIYNKIIKLMKDTGYDVNVDNCLDEYYFYFVEYKNNKTFILKQDTHFCLKKFNVLLD